MKLRLLLLGVVLLSAALKPAYSQDVTGDALSLLVHPTYIPDQSEAVHQPLANYLSRILEREIILITPRDFHKYWQEARSGVIYDMVLEDSHMAAYRLQRGGYQPLVRADNPMTFMLLSNDPRVTEASDLIGQRISTMSSPSLGYQLLARWFPNPMAQPQIMSTARSWTDSVEMVFAAEADATVAPGWLGERYPNLAPVAESEPFPGITLSVANRVSPTLRGDLREALLALDENSEDYNVLNELFIDRFVSAEVEAYSGLDELLKTLFDY
ncbi:MAG: hypothetical protein Tsb002_31290 [Wenzhouxiangellaceae bacterium]